MNIVQRFCAVFSISFGIIGGIIGLLFVVAWANDMREDRMHTVTANSLSPVFAGRGDEHCDHKPQLTAAQPGSTFQVQRIRYWKDCATLDLTLPGGRKGHIVLGVGDYSVHPPLRPW
jgi:hypothetical protein